MIEKFTDHEWAHMHDYIFHATWHTTKKKCTREELKQIFNELPEYMKNEAYSWGMNDTLWREMFIKWYEDNKLTPETV